MIVQGKMQQTIAYEAKIRDLINWVNLEKVLDIVKWWWYLIKAVAWDGVENINKTSDFEIYSQYNHPIMIRNQFIIADEMTWKKMKKVVDIKKWMW